MQTFIGYPENPRLVYGFSGFLNFKNWEFNFAFQGSGKRTFFINPERISPFVSNHAVIKAVLMTTGQKITPCKDLFGLVFLRILS